MANKIKGVKGYYNINSRGIAAKAGWTFQGTTGIRLGGLPCKGLLFAGASGTTGTSCLTSPLEPGYHRLIGTLQVDYLTGINYRHTEEQLSADGAAGGTSGLVQG